MIMLQVIVQLQTQNFKKERIQPEVFGRKPPKSLYESVFGKSIRPHFYKQFTIYMDGKLRSNALKLNFDHNRGDVAME